jgi:hypothetical protein
MADDKIDDKTEDTSKDDAEKTFWEKLTNTVETVVDKKLKEHNPAPVKTDKPDAGTSRTGHQPVTLKSLIANLVYGEPKD